MPDSLSCQTLSWRLWKYTWTSTCTVCIWVIDSCTVEVLMQVQQKGADVAGSICTCSFEEGNSDIKDQVFSESNAW